MDTFDCIVVGAGASGLVAAARMARAGRQVLVLEAAQRVGGCIHSWRPHEDFWLELGAHTAYNSYGPLLEAWRTGAAWGNCCSGKSSATASSCRMGTSSPPSGA